MIGFPPKKVHMVVEVRDVYDNCCCCACVCVCLLVGPDFGSPGCGGLSLHGGGLQLLPQILRQERRPGRPRHEVQRHADGEFFLNERAQRLCAGDPRFATDLRTLFSEVVYTAASKLAPSAELACNLTSAPYFLSKKMHLYVLNRLHLVQLYNLMKNIYIVSPQILLLQR